jgi:hypothetical protein
VNTGLYTSLALDAHGNPCISYYDHGTADLRYARSGIRLTRPAGGETWPVGSLRDIAWTGIGPVDVLLSTDGGASYQPLHERIGSNALTVRVPHTPTRFALAKAVRAYPFSESASDSFFTIETSIDLLSFTARLLAEGADGTALSWRTDPGPRDLAGYRLERAATGEDWRTLAALIRETSFTDAGGGAGMRYRLFAVNGLGEELLLGETAVLPERPLAAWPLPYRNGVLHISFAVHAQVGEPAGEAEVAILDPGGRRVRQVARGRFTGPYATVVWDGRDEHGHAVPAGIYFLLARSGGRATGLKMVVMP